MTLAPNLVITNQSIGDARFSAQFEGVDGIVGVGPVDLTLATLFPDVKATVPTVMNNLVSQNLIKEQVLGVYFAPATQYSDTSKCSMPRLFAIMFKACRWCVDVRRR